MKSTPAPFPASTVQKESGRMLSHFHTLRIEKLGQLWKQELYSRLGSVDMPDPMSEQYTSQILFEKLVAGQFCSGTA